MLTRKAIKRALEQERKYKEEEDRMALQVSWYCDQCAVEVYSRACPHCGKTQRQRR